MDLLSNISPCSLTYSINLPFSGEDSSFGEDCGVYGAQLFPQSQKSPRSRRIMKHLGITRRTGSTLRTSAGPCGRPVKSDSLSRGW
jgi:hypothetical protein